VQVYQNPALVQLERPVVSIGIFDGVHRGHRNLLSRVRQLAAAKGAPTLVITFWPHPRIVLGKADPAFKLLSGLEEKTGLLRLAGIDNLLVVPFTPEFAALPADRFISEFLLQHIRPGTIVVGDDLRFGAGGAGNLDLLIRSGINSGFEVIQMETHTEGEERISSTRIRNCLVSGDLMSANSLLGYPYAITGTVVKGNGIGNTIGFPTANIECRDASKQIPSDGVYAVKVERKGSVHGGMLNIGIRPTIGDASGKTIEVHLFDIQDDLYAEELRVQFIARLRDEMKFGSLTELKDQLGIDRQEAATALHTINRY
jgi:riboflavin kinase/FMN adenylyltransferase